jgi:leucyl-tRNA synthetase
LQACADKLEREISTFGLPPQFPTEQEQAEEEAAKTEAANKQAQESTADPTKFKTKKVN